MEIINYAFIEHIQKEKKLKYPYLIFCKQKLNLHKN